ncbi:hypothetical protein Hanom_Chr03g00267851 [Helianthus anomalus]
MEPQAIPVEELTSGASNRIILVCRNLHRSFCSSASVRRALIFLQSIILSLVLHLRLPEPSPPSSPSSSSSLKRMFQFRRREIEEDVLRRKLGWMI